MKQNNLLILGAGQYGQVVRETAEASGRFGRIAFLDDNNEYALGKMNDFEMYRSEFDYAFVALGNPQLRIQWLEKLETAGFELAVLVHPKAHVSPSALLGKGSIAEPMAVINTEANVGRGGLLCAGCVVNHNAHVGSGCQIDCGAVVASNAIVPEGTKVQSGTVFIKK